MDSLDYLRIYAASLETALRALNSMRTVHHVFKDEVFVLNEDQMATILGAERVISAQLTTECYVS